MDNRPPEPDIIWAVPDTYLSAPDYNHNFEEITDYMDATADAVEEYVQGSVPEQTGHRGFLMTNGTSTSWVVIPPIGSIIMHAGSTAPYECLICDGSAISRTTYADLFAVIGTAFGEGDGSTTFNIPNLIDQVVVGGNSPGQTKNITANLQHRHSFETYSLGFDFNTGYALSTEQQLLSAKQLLPCIKY